ncbi:MAG: DeoR/GlpR transcriptional regulator, partial [Leucobacter sp.]|nr:DeoR/GlpR transcriptional regulator [Leucobacter sp.]
MSPTRTPRTPADQRHRTIIDAVIAAGEVDVTALADSLGVSQMTVRRDLRHLDEAGLIRRVHGGATPGRMSPGLRSATMQAEKAAIAARVASMIQPRTAVGLDVGSTCTATAHLLSRQREMTVVTASLYAAMEFDADKTSVFLLGGRLTAEGAVVGTGSTDEIHVALDTIVLGCGGLSAEHGATYHDWDETLVRRGLVKHAQTVILAADHSKFDLVRP